MTPQQYIERVNEFIVPYLGKNGFSLIRTDFESEDGNWYLRLYIDLTEDEMKKRLEAAEAQRDESVQPQSEEENRLNVDAPQPQSEEEDCRDGDASQETEDEEEQEFVPGVSINDCVKVSRYLSKWLDKADFIKEAYTMEVCSKGFLDSSLVDSEEGESK